MQSSPAGGGVNIEAYDTPTASTFLEPSSNKRKFNDDADDEDSEDGEDEEIEESPKKKAKRANHRTSAGHSSTLDTCFEICDQC